VSTRHVLDTFEERGWNIVKSQCIRSKREVATGKHIVRLEHKDFSYIDGLTDGNKSRAQLVLLNSHDGTTALNIFWGLLRVACLNGIIAGTAMNGFRLIHSQSITKRVPEALDYMIEGFPRFRDSIQMLQSKVMSQDAAREFTNEAYLARLGSIPGFLKREYLSPTAVRSEDFGDDAFTVFNRVQERIMRGGIPYLKERRVLNSNGEQIGSTIIQGTTRKLSSVGQTLKLNRLVYDLAVKYAA
jgi:hypothetical protein